MIRVRDVLQVVSALTGYSVKELLQYRRLYLYRQVVCYVALRAGKSSVHIARVLQQDHSTVRYSSQRVEQLMGTDLELRALVNRTREELEKRAWETSAAQHARSALDGTVMGPIGVGSTAAVFSALTIVRTGNPQR